MVAFAFNANNYQPSTGSGSVLESGTYDVQITASEIKETKRRDGHFLELTYAVVSGPDAGKRVKDRLNINNPNKDAEAIAFQQLSAISFVIGRPAWQDTHELHGVPFKVEVEKVARQDDPTKYSNNILRYLDQAGNPPNPSGGPQMAPPAPAQPPAQFQQPQPAAQPPVQQQPAQQPPAGGDVPWGQPQQGQVGAPPAGGQPWGQPVGAPPAQQPQAGGAAPWQQPQQPAAQPQGGAVDQNTPPWQR